MRPRSVRAPRTAYAAVSHPAGLVQVVGVVRAPRWLGGGWCPVAWSVFGRPRRVLLDARDLTGSALELAETLLAGATLSAF